LRARLDSRRRYTASSNLVRDQQHLERCGAGGTTLPTYNLHGELSIGVALGDATRFAAVLALTAHDLQRIAAAGVTPAVAAGPASD